MLKPLRVVCFHLLLLKFNFKLNSNWLLTLLDQVTAGLQKYSIKRWGKDADLFQNIKENNILRRSKDFQTCFIDQCLRNPNDEKVGGLFRISVFANEVREKLITKQLFMVKIQTEYKQDTESDPYQGKKYFIVTREYVLH